MPFLGREWEQNENLSCDLSRAIFLLTKPKHFMALRFVSVSSPFKFLMTTEGTVHLKCIYQSFINQSWLYKPCVDSIDNGRGARVFLTKKDQNSIETWH